jgi:hypothetical protein
MAVIIPERLAALCACGCGEPAPLAKRNNARLGHVKGAPLAFVSGHNKRTTDPLRRVELGDDCWGWTGGHSRKGYGRCQVGRVHHGAHRVVYELLVEPVDPGMDLDHLCLNTGCVNPDHLEVVTPAENRRRQAITRRMTIDPSAVTE